MQGVAGAYHKLIACSWVPILQVGGLGKVRVNCFPKAITTWLGWESNPRSPDPESDALTTLPRCPSVSFLSIHDRTDDLFLICLPKKKKRFIFFIFWVIMPKQTEPDSERRCSQAFSLNNNWWNVLQKMRVLRYNNHCYSVAWECEVTSHNTGLWLRR